MKTAMQELKDILNRNYTHAVMAPETQAIFTYKIALKETLDKIDELLEKEKEQIIDACNSAFEDKTTWGERYYNKTYNQNK
jgi:hypothetical protein